MCFLPGLCGVRWWMRRETIRGTSHLVLSRGARIKKGDQPGGHPTDDSDRAPDQNAKWAKALFASAMRWVWSRVFIALPSPFDAA